MWLQTAFMLNLVWKNQEVDNLDPVNLKKAPQTHLILVELAAEHLLMAPLAFLAEQEVHLVGLLLHLEVLEMIKTEGTALKLKIKEEERREVIKKEKKREAMKGGQGERVEEVRRGAMGKSLGMGIVL